MKYSKQYIVALFLGHIKAYDQFASENEQRDGNMEKLMDQMN